MIEIMIGALLAIVAYLFLGYLWKQRKQKKQYKKCVYQVVEMLRAYNRNPADIKNCETQYEAVCKATEYLTATVCEEMLQYLPKEEQIDYEKQFKRDK